MTRCTAPEIGKYLHAFELNQLTDDQIQTFEEHLLTCDYCYSEISQFGNASRLLASDREIRKLVETAARSGRVAEFLSEIKAALWPSGRPVLLRPALAYFLLALAIYPAYLGFQTGSVPSVRSTQTVIMSGTRSLSQTTVDASRPLSLVFRVSGASQSDTLIVMLKDSTDHIVFEDRHFTSLSDAGLGTISFSEHALPTGQYSLLVKSQADSSSLAEYTFRLN